MTDTNKAITRLVIWACVAAILITVLIMGLNSSWLSNISLPFGGFTYANPETYSVGNAELADTGITAVDINWVSGSVNVEVAGDKFIIKENDGLNDADKLRYKVENGTLIIQFRESGRIVSTDAVKNFTVYVPSAVKLNSLKIDSVSAKLTTSNIQNAYTLTVHTVSGQFTAKKLTAERMKIETVSGEVTLSACKAQNIEVDTVSGNVSFDGSVSNVDANSVSGRIYIMSAEKLNALEIDTTSGDVTLSIPSDTGFTLDFDSASGNFNSAFAYIKNGDRYVAGDGSCRYEVDTVSGDVTINASEINVS